MTTPQKSLVEKVRLALNKTCSHTFHRLGGFDDCEQCGALLKVVEAAESIESKYKVMVTTGKTISVTLPMDELLFSILALQKAVE